MKKTKVENVSRMKLDFFLKQQNQDVRIVLEPGESSWCDNGSVTRSMILYERKKLIKTLPLSEVTIIDEVAANINKDEVLDKLHTTESDSFVYMDVTDIEYLRKRLFEALKVPPDLLSETIEADTLFVSTDAEEIKPLTPLEKAEKETEEYKKESEKTYKGKKRGRKKKRGPKKGSKRNKKTGGGPESINPDAINPEQ